MAWCYAGGNVISRKIKHVHFTQFIFVQQMMAFMVLSFYFAVSRTFSPKELSSINGKQITSYDRLLMFVLCICDFTAVCTQQLAFQKDSSSFISIISYMSIVYGFAADFFIFDIAVKFIRIIASCMIIVVNLFLTVSKFRTKQ